MKYVYSNVYINAIQIHFFRSFSTVFFFVIALHYTSTQSVCRSIEHEVTVSDLVLFLFRAFPKHIVNKIQSSKNRLYEMISALEIG